jgi:hypothetical protein
MGGGSGLRRSCGHSQREWHVADPMQCLAIACAIKSLSGAIPNTVERTSHPMSKLEQHAECVREGLGAEGMCFWIMSDSYSKSLDVVAPNTCQKFGSRSKKENTK